MRKSICGISTLPVTVKAFMLNNLNYMAQNGYDCYVMCNADNSLSDETIFPVRYIPIKMKWGNVSLFEVIKQIHYMKKIFKREHFDIIQYATSNAALYASIAGWLARVPVRIHLQWGIAYPEYHGLKRWFYRTLEKLTSMLSTSVQPDSKANLIYSIQDNLFKESKGEVLYNGSACGVDLSKYDITKRNEWRSEIRELCNIPLQAKVFGFVGRVVAEKGINELLSAFQRIQDANVYLIIVGPLNDVDRLDQSLYQKAIRSSNIVFTGCVSSAAKYFAAMDFLLLPSYREGFGMTVLEAAGVGTPSIVSNIKGPTDFVKDDINGIICEVKSSDSLLFAMKKALNMEEDAYRKMCNNAYSIVKRDFDSEQFKVLFYKNREYLLSISKQS